jgi:hypothetical protein
MREMARAFYAELYSSEGSSNMDHILNHIDEFVTADMNAKLTAVVSDKDRDGSISNGTDEGSWAPWAPGLILPTPLG